MVLCRKHKALAPIRARVRRILMNGAHEIRD
jgi:hypothetical protein